MHSNDQSRIHTARHARILFYYFLQLRHAGGIGGGDGGGAAAPPTKYSTARGGKRTKSEKIASK
jgi:hypothetical protein